MKKIDQEKVECAVIEAKNTSGLEALKFIPELNDVEQLNLYGSDCPKDRIKIVLFNAERGRYLDEIDAYMKYHPVLKEADVVFLNELDKGMARTKNLDTAYELSKKLSMNYIYGIEFLELTKGGLDERDVPGENQEGFHGNAIMSRYELKNSFLVRLPLEYDWFYDAPQERLGGRMALFTTIKVRNKEIGLICTHLENRTSPKGRARQMEFIMKQAEIHFKNIPVIVAGDMNTNTYDGNNEEEVAAAYTAFKTESDRTYMPEKYEPLFEVAQRYEFEYIDANVKGKQTRRKHKDGKEDLLLNLDWFFIKDFCSFDPGVVNTVFAGEELIGLQEMEDSEGIEISDHNAISVKVVLEDNS